jgi:hypothetical protein
MVVAQGIAWAKKVWGVDKSKGMRLASWGIAIASFGIYSYFDNKPKIVDHHAVSFGSIPQEKSQ